MRWMLSLLLLLPPVLALAETKKPVDIAIVVALDRSESIDEDDARTQIDGLVYALRQSRFRQAAGAGWHGQIGLSVIAWSSFGRHQVLLPWIRISGGRQADIAAALLEMDHMRREWARHGSQTDVGYGIEMGIKQLEALPWPAGQGVVNVVADGISNIGHVATVDRDAAVAKGITVNGLIMARGSAIEVLSRYFRREVIGGPTAFLQVSASNEDFANAMLRKLLLEMVRLRQPQGAPVRLAGEMGRLSGSGGRSWSTVQANGASSSCSDWS